MEATEAPVRPAATYFEPPHGTAPDLSGQDAMNPTAQILTTAMMLDHLGLDGSAAAMRDAVRSVYADGRTLTRDQRGTASTTELTDAVIARLPDDTRSADASA